MVWGYEFGVKMINFELVKFVIFWINDGFMVFFFFLIGLEIKWEFFVGELNVFKKAIFFLFVVIGGIVFLVLVFVLFNNDLEALAGWVIFMVIDIVFFLAIMKLLGDWVLFNFKVFFMVFVIVDDLGAVFIIVFFYSLDIKWMLILIVFVILGVLFLLIMWGLYFKYLFVVLGVVVWLLFFKAGIYLIIVGVLLAFIVFIY